MPDTLLGGIVISEFLADPNGANNFDTDGSGNAQGGDEFVELTNTSASAINISGLEFWDAGRDNWFTFPANTILQPGASVVVVRNVQNGGSLPTVTGNDLAFDADFIGNVFNNGGDNIVLYDPTNDEFIQATFNGDALDDPTATPPNTYLNFSSTATRIGDGEDFGSDNDGFSIQRTDDGFVNDVTPTPGSENICFASGTQIMTPKGFTAIEQLQVGDLVQTQRSGPQPIRWIYSRKVSIAEQLANPNLRPVALDDGSGFRVSRQHRVLVTGKIAARMFGQDEILVHAKDLIGHSGYIIPKRIEAFRYYHILLDRHHILNANGVAAESLYLGKESLHAISPAGLKNLAEASIDAQAFADDDFVPCRLAVCGHRVRRMAQRYSKNDRVLVTPF